MLYLMALSARERKVLEAPHVCIVAPSHVIKQWVSGENRNACPKFSAGQ